MQGTVQGSRSQHAKHTTYYFAWLAPIALIICRPAERNVAHTFRFPETLYATGAAVEMISSLGLMAFDR
jgi:hypothetical protein